MLSRAIESRAAPLHGFDYPIATFGVAHAIDSGMSAESEAFKRRTFVFAVGVGRLLKTFSRMEPGPTAQRQLAKSSSSTAANYRAACRGRSHAEFTAKLGISAEECDETMFWLEYAEAGEFPPR